VPRAAGAGHNASEHRPASSHPSVPGSAASRPYTLLGKKRTKNGHLSEDYHLIESKLCGSGGALAVHEPRRMKVGFEHAKNVPPAAKRLIMGNGRMGLNYIP